MTDTNTTRDAAMPSADEIVALPYGSPEQMALADAYWDRFCRFRERHPFLFAAGVFYIDDVRRKVLLTDVFYQANRRRNDRIIYSIFKGE